MKLGLLLEAWGVDTVVGGGSSRFCLDDPLIGHLMRLPLLSSGRHGPLAPLALGVLAALSLAAGVLGTATPAFAGDSPGAATHLIASVAGDFIAGTPQLVTFSAVDDDGDVDTSWTGPVGLSVNGPWFTAVGGIATFEDELDTAGPDTIIPVDGSGAGLPGVPLPVTVDAGPTAYISLSAPPLVGVGQPFTFTVAQFDQFGNAVSANPDSLGIFLANPDAPGQFVPASFGTYTASFAVQTPSSIEVDDEDNSGVSPVTANIDVGPAVTADTLAFSFDNDTSTAGDTTQVTVQAEDGAGTIATLGDPLTVISTDPRAIINGGNPVDLVDGVATFPVVFTTAGQQTLTATDGALSNDSSAIDVSAAAATSISLQMPTTSPFPGVVDGTVTAYDTYGNVATGDNDYVHLGYDGTTELSNPRSSTLLDAGVGLFRLSFQVIPGTETVTATADGLTPVSATVVVGNPATALAVEFDQTTTTAGQPRTLTIVAIDDDGFTVPISEPVTVTSTDTGQVNGGNPVVNLVDGVASVPITFEMPGHQSVTAVDANSLTGTADVTVDAAPVVTPPVVVAPPAVLDRLAGSDRFATATAMSAKEFPTTGSAGAVVLARSDDAADSAVGTVLAAAKNAPLLFTTGTFLPTATATEIARVLPTSGTVYVLGGTAAIPAAVATQLAAHGYHVIRLAGADRYTTAIAVADAIGGTGPVFLATGTDFADALTAGPAAARAGGVVLLTDGGTLPTAVANFLTARSTQAFAIGGQAAAADSSATAVSGADRYATAAMVAAKFFTAPTSVGVAVGTRFADALSGGAYLAHLGTPLLLTAPSALSSTSATYLASVKASVRTAFIFGGTSAVSDVVNTAVGAALGH